MREFLRYAWKIIREARLKRLEGAAVVLSLLSLIIVKGFAEFVQEHGNWLENLCIVVFFLALISVILRETQSREKALKASMESDPAKSPKNYRAMSGKVRELVKECSKKQMDICRTGPDTAPGTCQKWSEGFRKYVTKEFMDRGFEDWLSEVESPKPLRKGDPGGCDPVCTKYGREKKAIVASLYELQLALEETRRKLDEKLRG